jgi:hypothetical protein
LFFDWCVVASCGVEPEEQCTEQSVGTIAAAAKEKRSGAGGGLQGSGHLVWLSFVSILELMFGATASYMVSLNAIFCWF